MQLTGSTSFHVRSCGKYDKKPAMITQDEMEMYLDGIWEPPYRYHETPIGCTGDSCPINFGGKANEQDNL